jgi:PAS domain S-box-containing protein
MNEFEVAFVSIIAVSMTLMVINLRIWFSSKNGLANLLLSMAALGAGFLAVMELLQFNTTSLERYNLIIKITHIPIFMLIVSITWFVRFYFGTGRNWIAYTITSLWIVGLVINFSIQGNLTFSEIEGLKPIQTIFGETIVIPYGKVNPWANIVNLASLLFVIFVFDATLALAKSGNRKRAYNVGFSIIAFMLVAGIQTPLIDYGILKSAYMVSLPFVAILIAMNVELTNDLIRLPGLLSEIAKKEARWSKLLNDVRLPVIGVDSKGIVNYVNPYFLILTGYSKEEVIAKEWIENFIPEGGRQQLRDSFSRPLKDDFPRHFQNSILKKSGEELIVFWSNVSVEVELGKELDVIAVGNDVTEREEAFRRVLELKQELEVENLALKGSIEGVFSTSSIVVTSNASKYAFQKAKEVSVVDTTVLLQGETGVGKGIFAKYIHEQSRRADKIFLQVNCAAIPSDLLESELFGYEKGAFTGAVKLKRGRFELADQGTLFLDEIGELPHPLQAKLLRVLQSGEFERLGSEKTQRADVRLIAATNRVLSEEVQAGAFREDLYYRLNVFPITIPPLRKRREDIPELIEYFTHQFQEKYEKYITGISKQTYTILSKYSWPGNIRELQNIIERAVISTKGDTLKISEISEGPSSVSILKESARESSIIKLSDVERAHIIMVLDRCNWRIHGENGAAVLLDINPSTLRSRMKKLDIHQQRSIESQV